MARAAVLDRPNGAFTVEEYPVPDPAPGQFTLRTELSGTCATDTHIYLGDVPGVPYPVVMGHEFVGIIERLGPGVTEDTEGKPVAVGDRVVPMPATPCGHCYQCVVQPGPVVDCPNYDVTGFTDNTVRHLAGGWSEVIHFQNPRTRFFTTDLPAEVAVLAEPFATPVHGVQRVGVRPGDTVLVQGTGTVGLLAIAAAITHGATRVLAIGGPRRRLEVARAFGADVTIDIAEVEDSDERVRLVRDATIMGRGVDVAIEAAGVPAAVVEGIRCLRNGGRYLEVGCFADVGTVPVNPNRHLLANNITLAGSSGYGPIHFLQALRLLERRAFPYELLLTHRLPLARARDAVLALTPASGWKVDGEEVGKIAIDPAA
jgi:threonine dehydrogenase-like Zn-dependent dehydrogenase